MIKNIVLSFVEMAFQILKFKPLNLLESQMFVSSLAIIISILILYNVRIFVLIFRVTQVNQTLLARRTVLIKMNINI